MKLHLDFKFKKLKYHVAMLNIPAELLNPLCSCSWKEGLNGVMFMAKSDTFLVIPLVNFLTLNQGLRKYLQLVQFKILITGLY